MQRASFHDRITALFHSQHLCTDNDTALAKRTNERKHRRIEFRASDSQTSNILPRDA